MRRQPIAIEPFEIAIGEDPNSGGMLIVLDPGQQTEVKVTLTRAAAEATASELRQAVKNSSSPRQRSDQERRPLTALE
jgi:hypothetical protein